MRKPHRGLLLVEGKEEQRVIPQFMEKFITWGERDERDKWPADIVEFDGVEPLLKPGVIEAELKSPNLKALGVMIDANSDPVGRWNRIRARAINAMPTIPENLPEAGLVITNDEGLRFGVWLMPDCSGRGMLETFLALFIDNPQSGLWVFIESHCRDAKKQFNAPYTDAHTDKAHIHAWLALQDPPGQQLHSAIIQNMLKPNSPNAEPFVKWFRNLYQV
jgi:hypothetical protein